VSFFNPSSGDSFNAVLDLSKADMFSLGASLYELCKRSPLAPDGTEWHNIRSGKFCSSVFDDYSSEFSCLIQSLMSVDPNARPSAKKVVELCKAPYNSSICSSPIVQSPIFDPLRELEQDCSLESSATSVDTLRQVLNDHRLIIKGAAASPGHIKSMRPDDVILEAASTIDRLVFELKSLKREKYGNMVL
jgi:serine/threonine protein kinase